MARHNQSDKPTPFGLCKQGRRLRFEACESRLALDGAGFESIHLFEQIELTEFTAGGVTYSLDLSTSATSGLGQTADVYSFSDVRGTWRPILIIGNGSGNDISFGNAIPRVIIDGAAEGFSGSPGEYDQGFSELWRLAPLEPIQRLPRATEIAPEIATEAADSEGTITIANLIQNIPDEVFNQAPLTPVEQAPTQQPLKNPPPAMLASSAILAEESATERIQKTPSGQARAWAFEVASLDVVTQTTSLHTVDPKGAAPTPQSRPVAPTETGHDALPETTSSARFTAVLLSESNDDPQLLVDDLGRVEPNVNFSSQDAAFASLGTQGENQSPWRRQIDHRYGLAASLLALLVVDRVRLSSMLSGAESIKQDLARKRINRR